MSDFPWEKVKDYDEIIYEKYDGIAKITINRPERRNAFTPKTNVELFDAFSLARDDQEVGVIILTGANHDGKDEDVEEATAEDFEEEEPAECECDCKAECKCDCDCKCEDDAECKCEVGQKRLPTPPAMIMI